MAMVTCPNCGHANAETAKFCARCGNKLSPAETMVMSGFEDSLPLPDTRPPAMSAKEQAAFTPPPAAAPAPFPAPPPPRPAPPPSYSPPSYAPPPPVVAPAAAPVSASGHRFVAMRTIAGLANVLAIVSVALGILGGLVLGWQGLGGVLGILAGLFMGAIAGGLGWIFWRLLGEGIWVILDIESNTRRAAAALEEQRRP